MPSVSIAARASLPAAGRSSWCGRGWRCRSSTWRSRWWTPRPKSPEGGERGRGLVTEQASTERGQLFGERFRTVRLLKQSHGIETWVAQDLTRPGRVVLKTLSAAAVSSSVQHRLEHEASVLSELDSPFLSPLVHVGREDGLLYFAVPYVAGVTLEERLSQGPLPVDEAIAIASCVLAALEEAHGHGVLHRDVKPANVIVATDAPAGEPIAKLIDFGFA